MTELGLPRDSNQLRPYSPRWAELYELEAREIRAVLGNLARDVQHVGSTAIPGIFAKPILDIAVGIDRLDGYRECLTPLALIGYEHAPWAGLRDDEVFGKGADRTHLLHIVEFGGDKWRAYVQFRDRLRADIDLARKYEQLKIAMSDAHPSGRAAYTASKHNFIREVLDAV